MDDNFYNICGYLSGILFSASLIPQQIIFLLALIFLIIYSVHNDLKPVYIPAIVEFCIMVILLIMKFYYK